MKRILTVQDFSCFGRCSLTVALPVLSALGVEACAVPSAVLSTHTGGFQGYTFRDLTDDIAPIIAHWTQEKIRFDCFYTGYIGSARQFSLIRAAIAATAAPEAPLIVDPAMGDGGKLYGGFDSAFVAEMRGFAAQADYLLPNLTEAALLAGMSYDPHPTETAIERLTTALRAAGCKRVVLTGVGRASDETGYAVADERGTRFRYRRKLEGTYHGTGDLFAAAFSGTVAHGCDIDSAAEIAAEFVARAVAATLPEREKYWYGVCFESALPYLTERALTFAR